MLFVQLCSIYLGATSQFSQPHIEGISDFSEKYVEIKEGVTGREVSDLDNVHIAVNIY